MDLNKIEGLQLKNADDSDRGENHQHAFLINLRHLNIRYSGILKGSPSSLSLLNDTGRDQKLEQVGKSYLPFLR